VKIFDSLWIQNGMEIERQNGNENENGNQMSGSEKVNEIYQIQTLIPILSVWRQIVKEILNEIQILSV